MTSAYGPTAEAVFDFKKKHRILAAGQTVPDKVVGKMTIAKLDEMQLKFEQSAKPPLPPPLPNLGFGHVVVADVGARSRILISYYTNCGLETIGPARITTSKPTPCATLESMIDAMIAQPSSHHIIACHGNPDEGLTIAFSKETQHRDLPADARRRSRATGLVMGSLSALADMIAKNGTVNKNDPDAKALLGIAKTIHVSEDVVIRVATKCVAMRKQGFALHLRACNMIDPKLVADYKRAFGANLVTYHECRLPFCELKPAQAKKGVNLLTLKRHDTPRNRTRISVDLNMTLKPIGVQIFDVDGHTHVTPFCIMQLKNPQNVNGWVKWLIDKWIAPPDSFVVPIMWQNSEDSFHYPNEQGWIRKLRIV